MGNHTQVSAVSSEGDQIHVNQTTTDSPILPAENIRALAEIDPRFVDFVLTQTEKEANFRRGETIRTNGFVFKGENDWNSFWCSCGNIRPGGICGCDLLWP